MIYEVSSTAKFKKDYRLAKKQHKNMALLDDIIAKLKNGEPLPSENKDHALSGQYKDYRECHIQPDWLLIYRIYDNLLILTLTRTGSHSELFSK